MVWYDRVEAVKTTNGEEYMKKTVSNLKKLLYKSFSFLKGTDFRPTLLVFVAVVIAQPLSALKLPTGDSVRSKDVRQDGDALVEVVLGGDKASAITTPAGTVKAKAGTPVTFYKSGALKSLYPSTENGDRSELVTPIGKLILSSNWNTYDKDTDYFCEFYESGSPKRLFLYQTAIVTVGGQEFGAKSGGVWDISFLSFYDSGSKDVWLVKSLFGMEYHKDNEYIKSVSYRNKSGDFEINLQGRRGWNRIDFWPDGSIKSAPLYKSPEEPVLVKGNEVYIKGGENSRYNRYYRIDFFEDGSVRAFTPDEVCLTEQGGFKLTIVGGRRLCLWRNGNIQRCSVSNEIGIMVGHTEYKLTGKWTYKKGPPEDEYDVLLFNEDGSIRGFAVNQDDWDPNYVGERMIAADGFYVTGNPRRTINILGEYTNRRSNRGFRSEIYVNGFYNLDGDCFHPGETGIALMDGVFPVKYFPLQDGDLAVNVASVMFETDGSPKSYTLFRLDDWGDYLLDEYGIPIEDTETQKEFKK